MNDDVVVVLSLPPDVTGPARLRDWRQARRVALVVATLIADDPRNKSGEAPPPLLQRRARAWAAQ